MTNIVNKLKIHLRLALIAGLLVSAPMVLSATIDGLVNEYGAGRVAAFLKKKGDGRLYIVKNGEKILAYSPSSDFVTAETLEHDCIRLNISPEEIAAGLSKIEEDKRAWKKKLDGISARAERRRNMPPPKPIAEEITTSPPKPSVRSVTGRSSGGGAGVAVRRLYESSSIGHRVVITTDRPAVVKCALYDAGGNPLFVKDGRIEPPIDELQILTHGDGHRVRSVECWLAR